MENEGDFMSSKNDAIAAMKENPFIKKLVPSFLSARSPETNSPKVQR
jgi:hypothetical protein